METLDYNMYPVISLYDGANGWHRYYTTCLAEAIRQHLAKGFRFYRKVYSDGSIGHPEVWRSEDFCEKTRNAIDSFPSYEWYEIDEDKDGKYIHVLYSVWINDGREDDETGAYKPITVTEYTGCYVRLSELFDCDDNDQDRWEWIVNAQSEVSQYEGDYTLEEATEMGYGDPGNNTGVISTAPLPAAVHLAYDEISPDTPCGCYYTTE